MISESSGRKTSSTSVLASSGYLCSLIAEADGTNAATITLYDNPSAASGTILAKIVVDAGATYESLSPMVPIVANSGIYVDISGTGAAAIVHLSRG